jgi:intracellular septation protein
MQLFFDFLPVVAFLVAYKLGGIYTATGTLMIAMVALCGITWIRTRKVSGLMLTGTAIALVAGTLTLVLRNPDFIKWKLTLLDGAFAIAFLVAPYVSGKTLVERVMGSNITLKASQWRTLNMMWVAFFLFIAVLNLYVMYHFSEAAWVNFKAYGTIGLTLVFVVIQALWMANKIPREQAETAPVASRNDDQQMNGS